MELTFQDRKMVIRLYPQEESARVIRGYSNGMGTAISYHGVSKVIKHVEEETCVNKEHKKRVRPAINNSAIEKNVLLQV